MSVILYSPDELALVARAVQNDWHRGEHLRTCATLARVSRANCAAWERTYLAGPERSESNPSAARESRPRPATARELLRMTSGSRSSMSDAAPAFVDALRDSVLLAYNCVSNGGTDFLSSRDADRLQRHVTHPMLVRSLRAIQSRDETIEELRGRRVLQAVRS